MRLTRITPSARADRAARPLVVALAALCLAGAWPLEGEVKTRRRSDGVVVIYSEGTVSAPAASRRAVPEDLGRVIDRFAIEHDLDPRLVRAVIEVESAFDQRAVSSKGAQGLMQLMPATARALGVRDAFDPVENVGGGTRYLRQMIDRFGGSVELGLASYNAGPEAVERFGGVPPYRETATYIRRVFRAYGREPAQAPAFESEARSDLRVRSPLRVERGADGGYRIVTPE